jgi:hypothetical protein
MHHDKIFRLPGAYRHLVTLAKNVRVAPVHTSKRNHQSSDVNRGEAKDRDSDSDRISGGVMDGNHDDMTSGAGDRVQGEGTLSSMVPPAWMTPADYLSATSTSTSTTNLKSEIPQKNSEGRGGRSEGVGEGEGVGEYPFSNQVEKMWLSDTIPKLLHDIYSTSSSALHSSNIGLLPSALTKAAESDGEHVHSAHAESHSASHSSQNTHHIEATEGASSISSSSSSSSSGRSRDSIGDGDRGEIEGLRISFSLCASTYATTFLDHLVDTVNKQTLKK